MEIRHLRTFKTVASLLSFNKAAKELHYAQSSVSAQIQALEEELKVRLFDRLGRGIMLTEAGTRLFPYAQKVLDLSEEAVSEISGTRVPEGRLTIRVPESMAVYYLPPVIASFHHRFPNVRLDFTTCAHEGLQEDLRKGVTDMAFLLAEGIQAGDLEAEILGFEKIVMVAAPHHPLASKSALTAEDLKSQTLLFSKVDCSYRRILEATLKQAKIPVKRTLIFHSVTALKACLKLGPGLTVLPEFAVLRELARRELVKLPWKEGTFEVAVLMIWYKEKWLSPALRAFMEMVTEGMKKRDAKT